MREVDVALLFEKAAREIDVACALKVILAKRHGLTTEIVQQNYGHPEVFRRIRPRVVVLPFCYQELSNNPYLVRWYGATFFNLTWEQLFYPGNAKAKTPRGEFAVKHVVHNAWSDAYAALLRAQGVPEEHILVSGNPAYMLYDEPYRRYFLDRAALADLHHLDPKRRWVFFPENYNWAFYEQSMLDQMVRDGQPPAQVQEMRAAATRSFDTAMRWCAELATRDIELVIRPRPATPPEVFRRRVEEVLGAVPRGMSIIQRETVREWILASDVVVSSYSTSLIEASVCGKPAFMVEPEPLPPALRQEWHTLVPTLRSAAEFVDTAVAGQSIASPLATWARTNLLGRGDPLVRIADHLAKLRHGRAPVPTRAPWESITLPSRYRLPPRLAFELRRRILTFLQPPIDRPVDAESRVDVAALAEIPARVQRWERILDGYAAREPAA